MKKKNDGYKTIKSLFYVVAIISMIIAIFGKVSAEGYSVSSFSSYILDCYDYSSTYHTEYTDSLINDIISSSVGFYEFYNDNNEHLFVFSNNEYAQGYVYNQRFNPTSFTEPFNMSISKQLDYYYGSNSFTMFYTDTNHRINLNNLIVYSVFTSNNALIIYKGIVGSNTYWQDLSASAGYYISFENRRYKFNSNDGTWTTGNDLSSFTAKYYHSVGNNVIGSYYNDSFRAYTSPEIFSDDMLDPTVDDNFIIYKSYGAGGISDPLLNIQYADNIFSQGYTYTSSTTYSLTFDVDGTETTVSISSSAYPDDFFENGSFRTSFDLIYRMLSNKIMNFSSADSVTLTAVSMSATAYPTSNQQGTPETVTKSTLCNLVLKGSQGSTDIESDVIPDITDVTTVFSQVGNTQDFYNSSGFITNNDFEIPDWTGVYNLIIYDQDQMSLQDAINAGYSADYLHPYSALNLYEYDSLEIRKKYAMDLLFINGIIQNVDIVRVRFLQVNQTGIYVHADFVFYTNNYWTKLSIKGIGNVQSAIESGTYYTKSLYWYLKQRLDNMSDNIAEYEEKALSNQVVGNGYLQSINTNIISIKDSIDIGVNSIVSAISGISGGSSSYSLPSLSTELQRLFVPSLTWESIDFDDYMDSLGVLKIPFEMTNDVLDVTKASYSSTLDLHINDFEIDVTGNNDRLTVFEDQDYSFNPRSIFNNQAWTMLTYLNAFAVILAEAWFTYCHIFRREKADDR